MHLTSSRIVRDRLKLKNKTTLCFCFGFLWSTVLAFIAFGFCQLFWLLEQNEIVYDRPCERRVVGYYHLSDPRELTIEQLSKYTHIVFVAVHFQMSWSLGFSNMNEKEKFKKMNERAKPFKVKTMFTLEIGYYAGTKYITELMEDPIERRKLIKTVTKFIQEHELDGVHLHWESPKTKEEQNFISTMCKEIREGLTRLQKSTGRCCPYTISMIWPKERIPLDFDEVLDHVDFLNLETDTYFAPWNGRGWNELIGPATPLFRGHGKYSRDNLDETMKMYSCITRRPHQLNVLVNFSGRIWRNVIPPTNPSDTLWMRAQSKGGEVDGTWEFWRNLEEKGWKLSNASWNDESKTPYIYDREKNMYMAFENERSMQEKMKYLEEKNIGGVTTWDITRDDDMDTLLNTMVQAKLCSRENNKKVMYNCP